MVRSVRAVPLAVANFLGNIFGSVFLRSPAAKAVDFGNKSKGKSKGAPSCHIVGDVLGTVHAALAVRAGAETVHAVLAVLAAAASCSPALCSGEG